MINYRFTIKLILFILINFETQAQLLNPYNINCSGSTLINQNVSLNFIVGDLILDRLTDSSVIKYGNGFLNNTISINILTIVEAKVEIVDISIFPNPGSEFINIKVNNSDLKFLEISIVDFKGQEVFSGLYNIFSNLIRINSSSFNIGAYFLLLKDKEKQILGKYLIIKK